MSKEKPRTEYETKVKKFGNGAKIKAYKKHIGKRVKVYVDDPSVADLTEMSYEHGKGRY